MVVAAPELRRPSRYAGPDEVKAAVVSGLTKMQAKDVLDWLENHGGTGLAVTTEPGGFVVRCVCPPGFRLDQQEDGGLRFVHTGT